MGARSSSYTSTTILLLVLSIFFLITLSNVAEVSNIMLHNSTLYTYITSLKNALLDNGHRFNRLQKLQFFLLRVILRLSYLRIGKCSFTHYKPAFYRRDSPMSIFLYILNYWLFVNVSKYIRSVWVQIFVREMCSKIIFDHSEKMCYFKLI